VKTLIVTALFAEAVPLIHHFKLKKTGRDVPFRIYTSSDMDLIVSGIGKLRAAVATTFLIHQAPSSDIAGIINIGICGGARQQPIGQLFLIQRITDAASGKIYRLHVDPSSEINLSTLVTVDRPLTDDSTLSQNIELVDMEASGFFTAASLFLPKTKIACLKIVSDHLNTRQLNKPFVQGLIQKNLTEIEKFIQKIYKFTGK